MEWLKKIGLSKWMKFIHFPGYIRNTELPAIIASARVFLYPSKRESFGIPVLEGMACGTPVITSNVTSMPEVGGDAALFVDPHSVESIKEAILYLLSHPEEQMRLSEKGLLRAAEFSWRHTAEETLKIYKEIHNAEI